MLAFPFYRLATIGWANPLIARSAALLGGNLEGEIRLDLSGLEFVDAFGVTYLAACCDHVRSNPCNGFLLPPKEPRVHKYLQDVGLYESIGLGDRFEPRRLSNTRVDVVHLMGGAALQPGFVDPLLDFLEHMQPFDAGLRLSMRTSLYELLMNFTDHSGSAKGAWVSGQFHPHTKATKRPRITLCVLDLGRGIPNALRSLPSYRRSGDAKLVEIATDPGVSSVSGSRGLGLSTIRRFVDANGGDLTIIAGKGRVIFRARRRPMRRLLSQPFPGTAVFMSLVPTERGLYVLNGP